MSSSLSGKRQYSIIFASGSYSWKLIKARMKQVHVLQSEKVTTTVIPSEPGEVGTPWWVWLLAAIAGIILLAAITYCLYKVTTRHMLLSLYPLPSPNDGGFKQKKLV